jgi:hypothetical protein
LSAELFSYCKRLTQEPRGFSQTDEQIDKVVDFRLRAKVVEGVGPLFPADANWYDITAQGERILVILVITHVQDPVAPQAIPFGGQGVPFMATLVHHKIHYLLTSEHTNTLQLPGGCEDSPADLCFPGGLAVMYGQRETFVLHPHSRKGSKLKL